MNLPEPFYKGKVRNLYAVDDQTMLIVATDRVSAFDVVFPDPVPEKGITLNTISTMWFDSIRTSGLQEELNFRDHMISTDISEYPEPYKNNPDLKGRSMLVKRTNRVDFECVVRGYLAGSGWKEYVSTGAVCGHQLPDGLKQASRLPEPIFTPATKAPDGEHDENVSVEKMKEKVGIDLTRRLERISIELYKHAADIMSRAGIILCDTKFEFGVDGDEIYLIDEALTPDSSRYWDAAKYKVGTNPPGYDKQYIRDYSESLGWDKKPPAPSLPSEVIQNTRELYDEISRRIESVLTRSNAGS